MPKFSHVLDEIFIIYYQIELLFELLSFLLFFLLAENDPQTYPVTNVMITIRGNGTSNFRKTKLNGMVIQFWTIITIKNIANAVPIIIFNR